ncbi:hypothetical protein SETIT_3G328500v2 [Setaria italica]|uniref:Uncharacterized protein n=1 Tax=Setaria italica TaxID=4555 RepID=A0A368QLB4_SETIT|nr:hypothetical protein SETIT_3G328500v2 [Setaria italica]
MPNCYTSRSSSTAYVRTEDIRYIGTVARPWPRAPSAWLQVAQARLTKGE